MINRIVCVGMAVAFLASLAVPSAARAPERTTRTLELHYECPCGVAAWGGSVGFNLWGTGGVSFEVGEGERYVHMVIDDDVAQTVAAKVGVDTVPGNFSYEHHFDFCNATEEPIEVEPGWQLDVYFYSGECDDDSTMQSFPTEGTLHVTLSNIP